MTEPVHISPEYIAAGLKGLCPRCGARTLFAGVARFAPVCPNCGLEFAKFHVDDGPAAFLTLGIGTLVTIAAITLELTVSPPFWVHFAIWTPVTLLSVVASLRVAKGMLILAEYRNDAREGRIRDEPPEARP
ncbi:DUF983 domain-containing protein [Sphingomonas montana]|uniref:DUF983 domain-containing protein n=1 Tax=Sphingomonas montana TaxID=1843236 RepID=UPI00096FF5E8|nr:DUF983 domain-containing protein [Sphingomonas montana]